MFESTTTSCRLRRFLQLCQKHPRKGLSMVLSPFSRAPIYGLIVSTPGRSEEGRSITNKSVISLSQFQAAPSKKPLMES